MPATDIIPDDGFTASALAGETMAPPPETGGASAATEAADPAATATPAAVPASEAVPAGPDSIVFSVSADSWIEVTDANNQRLYMNLARTGDILNLHGTAPFDVLLGFAQGVTVEFNGSQFNQAPYSRAGVARFTLGE
jgi:cytoskeleton protein RodZ